MFRSTLCLLLLGTTATGQQFQSELPVIFEPGVSIPFGFGDIVVADLDNDLDPDLLPDAYPGLLVNGPFAGNLTTPSLPTSVLTATRFLPGTTTDRVDSSFANPAGVSFSLSVRATGDIDNDGDADVVVGGVGIGASSNLIRPLILENLVDLGVATTLRFGPALNGDEVNTVPGNVIFAVHLADLDGDGFLDALIGSLGGLTVFQNLPSASGRQLVDVTAGFGLGFVRVNDIDTADFDGDGDLDIAVALHGMGSQVVINNGGFAVPFTPGPTFGATAGSVHTRVLMADLNGLGTLDVVTVQNPLVALTTLDFLFLDPPALGAAPPGAALPYAAGAGTVATDVESGDMDGDGDIDVVVGRTNSVGVPNRPAVVFLNDGFGGLTDGVARFGPSGGDASGIELLDIDNDADLDILVVGSTRIFRNHQAHLATAVVTIPGTGGVTAQWDITTTISCEEGYALPGVAGLLATFDSVTFAPTPLFAIAPIVPTGWSSIATVVVPGGPAPGNGTVAVFNTIVNPTPSMAGLTLSSVAVCLSGTTGLLQLTNVTQALLP